jgi:L-lactate dehydrogenase complex protein LldG
MEANIKKERRQQFFNSLKTSLTKNTLSVEAREKLETETKSYQNFSYTPQPLSDEEKLPQFKQFMRSQSAEIYECKKDQAIEKVAEILKEKPYGSEILIGNNSLIKDLKETTTSQLVFKEVGEFDERHNLSISLTTAFAAASETGTLFLSSGNENPTWLNYLATCNIILLDQSTLCQTYEQAFEIGESQAEHQGLPFPPRSINMISGPSRTADIEQTLTLGAHGPIELIVVLYRTDSEE